MRTSYSLLALVICVGAWMNAAAETPSIERQQASALSDVADLIKSGISLGLAKKLVQREAELKDRISRLEQDAKFATRDRAALIQSQKDFKETLARVQEASATNGRMTTEEREEFVSRVQRTVSLLKETQRQYGEQLKEYDQRVAEQEARLANQESRVAELEKRANQQAANSTATEQRLEIQQMGMAELSRKVDALTMAPAKSDVSPVAGGFLTLGAMYGSVRTDIDGVVNTENRPVGLARLGYRFGDHFSIALEGSYWKSKNRTVELPDGRQVSLNRALTDDGSAVALPLYFKLSDSFPLVLYAGVGMGWESHEIVQMSSTGREVARQRVSGSGRAIIAGAGFEFRTGPSSSLSLVARGVRSRMSSLSSNNPGDPDHQPERTVLSVGAAWSLYP